MTTTQMFIALLLLTAGSIVWIIVLTIQLIKLIRQVDYLEDMIREAKD